ncbi:MAG: carbonic anhydrase family protein, partial [Anaerobacillus sp.]
MLKKIIPAGVLSLAMLVGCSAETEKRMDKGQVEEVTWSYEGETGPSNWDTLHLEYAACGEGEKQSPINIDVSNVELNDDLEALDITYQPTPFSLENNGHTVQLIDPTGEN